MHRDKAEQERALGELFDESYDRIFRFCAVRCRSEITARDITAETFAEAARVTAQDPNAELDVAWLFMVARRRMVDHWRRMDRQRRTMRRLVAVQPSDSSFEDTGDDALDDSVRDVLDTLPEHYSTALTMRYIDEQSVTEVAASLELSYRAAESVLARARRAFVQAWSSYE